MEHRYSVRSLQIINVCLQHPAIGVIHTRTANIGLGGLFVPITHPRLTANALVRLSFYLGARRRRNQYHVQAMVMHNGPNGIGLMFDDRDDELHRALLDFVTGHHDQTDDRASSRPQWPLQPVYNDRTLPALTPYHRQQIVRKFPNR